MAKYKNPLCMAKPERKTFDPSKITGPFPLLAAMLIVVETAFGVWLVLSQNSIERIVLGLIMATILVCVLIVTLRITRIMHTTVAPQVPQASGNDVTPAKEASTESELKSLPSDVMAGPGGFYTINMPPKKWQIRNWTLKELVMDSWQINDTLFTKSILQAVEDVPNVLTMDSGKFSILPVPGKTKINGRKIPTGLEVILKNRISVIPLSKYTPFMSEGISLEHNALKAFSSFIITPVYNIQKISQGEIPHSGRRYISLELKQDLEWFNYGEILLEKLQSNILAIIVEGDVSDFLVLISYASTFGKVTDLDWLSGEVKILAELASSLRPLKIPNPEMVRQEMSLKATTDFERIMTKGGRLAFNLEWHFLIARLSSFNLEKSDDRSQAIALLKPFIALANELKIEEPSLLGIASAVKQAEKGNADALKDTIALQILINKIASLAVNSTTEKGNQQSLTQNSNQQ